MTEIYNRPIRQRVGPEGFGSDVVVFTWRPGDRTPYHNHNCSGVMTVTEGALYEVRNGVKRYASSGDVLKVGQGSWHIVGNDSTAIARTVHVYFAPELQMETAADTPEDAAALASALG